MAISTQDDTFFQLRTNLVPNWVGVKRGQIRQAEAFVFRFNVMKMQRPGAFPIPTNRAALHHLVTNQQLFEIRPRRFKQLLLFSFRSSLRFVKVHVGVYHGGRGASSRKEVVVLKVQAPLELSLISHIQL